MKTLARKILHDYNADGGIDIEDAIQLAIFVLGIKLVKCGTCHETNLVDKPEEIEA